MNLVSGSFFIAIYFKKHRIQKKAMKIVMYDKLVRSKVIDKLKAKNIYHTSRIPTEIEHKSKLYKKLPEESYEFLETGSKEELVDVLEVLKAIIKLNGWDESEIEEMRLKKREKEGSFEVPLILMECEKKPL
jgi:predicted house-cleaning noncanonical NTP pyrophosphatase (MazG superfamily)